MTYLYELPNETSGIDAIMLQMTSGSFSFIVPMFLFFTFIVVFIGGITRQKTRTGTSDYSAWAVISSMATLLVALLFSVTSGFISVYLLATIITITIGSGIWFFFDRKGSEL